VNRVLKSVTYVLAVVYFFPLLEEVRARFRTARPWWPPFDPMITEWESEFGDMESDDD
jgi:hypothetical protein